MSEQIKFKGTIDNLENEIKKLGWFTEHNKGNVHLQVKTNNGMLIDCYDNGTIYCQLGTENEKDLKSLNDIVKSSVIDKKLKVFDDKKTKIYIVHGHDDESKKDLELILNNWGLKPIISQKEPNKGKYVLEGVIKDIKQCDFAFVLWTPDDLGRSIEDSPEGLVPRARQNVILELGMVKALLKGRFAILRKGETEIPTDISGLLYIPFENKIDEIKENIKSELGAAKIKI